MKVLRLHAEHFTSVPGRGYATIISDPEQLRVCHCHDYFEVFIVNQGSAVHRVNGTREKIATGMLYFMRPDDVHYYDHPSPNFKIINILVPSATIQGLFDYLGEGFSTKRLLAPAMPPRTQLNLSDLTTLVNELEQLLVSKKIMKDNSDTVFRIALFNIIVKYFPIMPTKQTKNVPDWLRWLSLEMLKKEHFSEGLPALYRLSGKSVEHLSRTCQKYLNKTPSQLVNDIRLEYAALQLINTENSIMNICEEAGFNSLSHFYHLFNKYFGISPSRFREDALATSLKDSIPEDYFLQAQLSAAIPLKEVIE